MYVVGSYGCGSNRCRFCGREFVPEKEIEYRKHVSDCASAAQGDLDRQFFDRSKREAEAS